jgi:phosphate:Na+ symporter
MNTALIIEIVFQVSGGLGIFLLGMRYMADGMQAVAGDRLRSMINAVTNNRILACLVGVMVTCLIQSSSITTVMAVGMVNAGVMSLVQSIGVILGANIGTTITGWILALKVGKYGLPIIGVSALVYLFSRREKLKYTFMLLMGLGMIFFGLELMSNGFKPLRTMEEFQMWFARFSPHSYLGVLKCCLVGAAVTALVQSSSATLGITISLATVGVIDFPTAAALVLGENIGTTITAYLASLGASVNAKRASYAHIFVNIFGVIWITPIFGIYIKVVTWMISADPYHAIIGEDGLSTFPNMAANIAAVHTGFNLVNVIVLLPLVGYIARVLEKIVPESTEYGKEIKYTHLDPLVYETPAIGIQQSMRETIEMYFILPPIFDDLGDIIINQKFKQEECDKIMEAEHKLDLIQKEITEYVSGLMSSTGLPEIAFDGYRQIRIADEVESVSDYLATILKLNLKIRDIQDDISGEGLEDIISLHKEVSDMVNMLGANIRKMNVGEAVREAALMKGEKITRYMKLSRARHLERVSNGTISPLKSLSYTDMLTSYRKIKDHLVNIAEVIATEKQIKEKSH